jgi:hypothetical protein
LRILAGYPVRSLHAAGDRREKFGEPDRDLADIDTAGPLTEILA